MTNVNYLSDRIGLKWNAERWHMIIIILPVRDLQKTASLPLPLYPLLSSARPVSLLKYLCLFVYFYDFASMHKSVNVRQTTTDDGRWQADGGRDLITCSDKDTTDRTT